jgi:cytochrome P450
MTPTVGTEPIYYDPYDYVIDANPHPVWQRMREEQPVYYNEKFGFWALSRFDDVWSAYLDTTTFSSSHGVELRTLDAPIENPPLIFMDPPQHDRVRKLVSRAFTPKRVSALEESIAALAGEYLDALVGEASFDYVSDFAALVPPMVIGELLGVPEADRNMVRLWVDEMFHLEDGETEPGPQALAALGNVYGYLQGMVAERRRSPQDDLVSALLDAEVEDADGTLRKLDDAEVLSFVVLLNGAGVETVARLLSWAAVLLARNPDERTRLVRDPALVPNAIEELLRYEAPSPVNGRWVTRPVEFHGITIPAESKILLLNGSANRDHREFDDPDRFDVSRSIKRHITFGYGTHFCLGAALARLEGRIALAETLARIPTWEIDESEVVMVRTGTVRGYSSVRIHIEH